MRAESSIAAAAVLFASAGVAAGFAPPAAPAALFGVARLLVGGALLAGYVGPGRLARTLRRLPPTALAVAACSMALFQWTFFAAVGRVGVGTAALLSAAASPLVADVLSLAASRTRPGRTFLCGAALTVLACGLVLAHAAAAGVVLAVLSGCFYSVYAAAAAHLERAERGGLACTALALLAAGAVLLPASASHAAVLASPAGLLVVAWLGVGATALAYALFVAGLRQVSAATALAILLVQPLAALAAGAWLLGEPLDAPLVGAATLVAFALGVRAVDRRFSSPQRSQR